MKTKNRKFLGDTDNNVTWNFDFDNLYIDGSFTYNGKYMFGLYYDTESKHNSTKKDLKAIEDFLTELNYYVDTFYMKMEQLQQSKNEAIKPNQTNKKAGKELKLDQETKDFISEFGFAKIKQEGKKAQKTKTSNSKKV